MTKLETDLIIDYQEILNYCEKLSIDLEINVGSITVMYKNVVMETFEDLKVCISFLKGFEWKEKLTNSVGPAID